MTPDTDYKLPEGWRWAKLGEVSEPVRGVSFPSAEASPQQKPDTIGCVTTRGVQASIDWDATVWIPSRRVQGEHQLLAPGDLLVSTANSKALVGKSCLIGSVPFPATFGAFVTVLRPRSQVLPQFLSYCMRDETILRYFYETSSNTTNISNLRVGDVLARAVPLPPLPEQRRIAAILTEQMATVDKARAAAEVQLKAAQALPAAYLREVFESEEAKAWPTRRLGEVCQEVYRYPTFYGMEHLSEGVPVIRGEHIDASGEVSSDWRQYWFIAPEVSEQFPRTVLQEGDIVFTVRGTIGKAGAVRSLHHGAQLSPNLIRISPGPEVATLFLWYYLQHIKGTENAVEDNAVTIATVKASDLVRLPVPLPKRPEQDEIGARLQEQMRSARRAGQALSAQLTTINALPAALLRQAFSGGL